MLALTFDEMANTRGVGTRRIEKLVDVLERACKQLLATSDHVPDRSQPAPLNGTPAVAEPTTPENLTEPVWQGWCHTIRSLRLEGEALGRFASSLADLQQVLWSVPLQQYTDKPLQEIRSMPGHGPARVGQVLDVFYRIAQTIAGCPADAPLAVCLLSPLVREALLWTESMLRTGSVPDVQSIRDGFLVPLFALLEVDLGPETVGMVRRRLGLDGPAETLDQIANDFGLTRERVRQLTAKAAEVTKIRWPEGRFILDNVYAILQSSPGAEEQLNLMHSVLDTFFALEFARGGSRNDVLSQWDRAGRAKRTPMSEGAVRSWGSEEFPNLPFQVIRRWLEEEGLRFVEPSGNAIFFSNDPLDRLLLHLHTHPEPLPVGELQDFVGGDERNVRLRIDRDPRFIEDELKRVSPAEKCSFFRTKERWFMRLNPIAVDAGRSVDSVDISDLIHIVVGGLVQSGVCDATVWGVHRFACVLLRKVFGANLLPSVTPFVLASTFIRHSDG
ncbi:MAG: hypothetical protein WCL32_17980, partial [Planctomycetota bacterium]